MKITDLELGWVAGIIEGEGNLFLQMKPSGVGGTCQIRVGMSDNDVVCKLQEITGLGKVYIEKPDPPNKQMFTWKVQRREEVKILLLQIIPLLGERRKNKALEMIEFIKGREEANLVCKYGHPWTSESTGFCKTGRYCKPCKRAYQSTPKRKEYMKQYRISKAKSSPSEV